MFCASRHLAYILSKNLNEVISDLGNDAAGYSLTTIIEYCKKEVLRCVCMHNNEVLDRIEAT